MNQCCDDLENRTPPKPDPGRPGLSRSECVVCGAKHFELDLDAAIIAGRGEGL